MKKQNIEDWIYYLTDLGIEDRFVSEYVLHAKQAIDAGVPPIFEDAHLSNLLGKDLDILYRMVRGTESFYRTFHVKKRSGGRRTIVSPYPSLLEVQKWILKNILNSVEINRCATGFRAGASIKNNAAIHCRRDVLLKFDIKDFFPSISIRRVIKIFRELGYSPKVAYILGRLCTLNGMLPQGAATSPAISNIVCRQMDQRIYGLCKHERLRYSRYADDIVISGGIIKNGARALIEHIICRSGFVLNESKTRLCLVADRKIVTGLDITSGSPRVTKNFRRDLQRDVYFVWSSGLGTHLSRRKIFNPNYIEHLEGRVAFWASIEPASRQMQRCRSRLNSIRKLTTML